MLKNVVAEKKYNFKSDTMKGEILEQQGKPTESVWTFLDGAVRVFPGVLLTPQVEIQNTIDALYAYAEEKKGCSIGRTSESQIQGQKWLR